MSFAEHIAAVDRAVLRHLGSEAVTYASTTGWVDEVVGMFDEAYVLVDPAQADVEQVGPAVWLRLDDLPIHPDEDDPLLTIRGKAYRVSRRQSDGAGGIRLLLHLAE